MQTRSPVTELPTNTGPYAPASRVKRSFALTCVLPVNVTSPVNDVPAIVTSVVVPVTFVAPWTVVPKSCTALAAEAVSPPLIVESVTTTVPPLRTVIPPRTVADATQVTPLVTVILFWAPVSVVSHSGMPPGSTVVR